MSGEIDFVLHNAFADTWWVLLKDSRCAHLMFRNLWDVNPNAHCSTTTSLRSIIVGVSYDLYNDKVVDIYGDFFAPMDSVRLGHLPLRRSTPSSRVKGMQFLREVSLHFDITFPPHPTEPTPIPTQPNPIPTQPQPNPIPTQPQPNPHPHPDPTPTQTPPKPKPYPNPNPISIHM